jgi:hypothetical protein
VSRARSSMVLLGISMVALLIGALSLGTQHTPRPTGSSYSAEPNGAQGLYTWIESIGGSPVRLQEPAIREEQAPSTLVVLQPETALDSADRDAFDAVPRRGGTLIVAGDSLPWLLYARNLGVTVEPIRNGEEGARTPDGSLYLPIEARYRVRADRATPLLIEANGDWVALRMAYKQGSLIVLGTPQPLLNDGLRDDQTARFVYHQLLAGASTVAFDEAHHSFAPLGVAGARVTVNQLLLTTAPGRAVVYAALLVFGYLFLSGQRLGPPVPPRAPTETRRTMYEHVQMLANLYRRAGQFRTVRDAFSRHYTRLLARGGARTPTQAAALAEAVLKIDSARSESELIAAVAGAHDAG